MKVSEAIARAVALDSEGAPVFALIGDANLPMIGALDRFTDVKLRFARHEGAAVAMADGYAQITGGLGLASVTSGTGRSGRRSCSSRAAAAYWPPSSSRRHSRALSARC